MDESKELVSIIIPAHNSAETIERAVRSALSQTYTDIEVIVVDDGSEDDTPQRVEAIAAEDERVKLLLKPRAGVSAARNDGIMSAAGEWFMTLDADDYYDTEAVSQLHDAALRTDADCVMCGVKFVYPDGKRRIYKVAADYTDEKGDFISNLFTELYDRYLITTHSNKIFRTDITREYDIYYNEFLSVHEDIDFVFRFFRHCAFIGVIDGAYLNYTQHAQGESLIGIFRPNGIAGALLVLRDLNSLFEDIYVSNRTIDAANLRAFWHIMSYVGIMYSQSGYSDLRKLTELKELGDKEDFRRLLRELSPDGPKSALAKILLRFRLYGVYHALARLMYRDKNEASETLSVSSSVLKELSRIPYLTLGIYSSVSDPASAEIYAAGDPEDVPQEEASAISGETEETPVGEPEETPVEGSEEEPGEPQIGEPEETPEIDLTHIEAAEDTSPELDLSIVNEELSEGAEEPEDAEKPITAADMAAAREKLKDHPSTP